MIGLMIFYCFIVGILLLCFPGGYYQDTRGCHGLEFLNPLFLYETHRINIFGTIVLCLLYNLICPIASIGYWFYKLCTFGRKKK